MSVYIEYVILDNFVLTYFLGLLSFRALKTKNSKLRNFISACLGTTSAVLYPFFDLHIALLIALKIALLMVLGLILFYKKTRLFLSIGVFLGLTFLLGGAFFAIGYFVYGDAISALTLPAMDFPLAILILIAGAIYLLLKRLLIRFHKNRSLKAELYKIEMQAGGKRLVTEGFCDSGNRIFDPKTGLPVVVLSLKLTIAVLGSEAVIKLMSGAGQDSYKGARSIEYQPHGTKPQRLWLIKPDKFLLYLEEDKNIHIDVMLGLSTHSFSDTESYGALFGLDVAKNT